MKAGKPLNVPVGEYRVSADPGDILFTCVGSCVAVALYDSREKIAGLLHIVLPGNRLTARSADRNAFYADTGIPLLLRVMEDQGADRNRMTATVAGGACLTVDGNPEIGLGNIEKSIAILVEEGIPVIRQETGGSEGRVVEISVADGDTGIKTNSRRMTESSTENAADPLPASLLTTLASSLEQMRPDKLVAGKLFEAIHKSEINWQEVSDLVSQDIMLSLHLFQKFNSEYFGIPQKIGSFAAALSCLGPDKLRRILVVAAAEKNSTTSLAEFRIDQKTISRHSMASAITAQHLAVELLPEFEKEAFTAALVHPLGCIAAGLLSRDSNPGQDEGGNDCCRFTEEIDSAITMHHQRLASALLARWEFPHLIVEALSPVRFNPAMPPEMTLAAVVETSCNVSTMLGIGGSSVQRTAGFALSALEQIKLVSDNNRLFPDIIIKLRNAGLLK